MNEQPEEGRSGYVVVGALLAVVVLWFSCRESAECRRRGGIAVTDRFRQTECLDVQRK